MQRWNGWGNDATTMALLPSARAMLRGLLGTSDTSDTSDTSEDAKHEKVLTHIPASRLPAHPEVARTPPVRLAMALGESFSHWIRKRSGAILPVLDGTAYCESGKQLRERRAHCPAVVDAMRRIGDWFKPEPAQVQPFEPLYRSAYLTHVQAPAAAVPGHLRHDRLPFTRLMTALTTPMSATRFTILFSALAAVASPALAWSDHAMVTYRALERMPELAANVRVPAEPLEAFLKNEEAAIEELLSSEEAWARQALDGYAPRPDALAFKADPAMEDTARRLAFFSALRISQNSRFALYVQPDPWGKAPDASRLLPASAVMASSDAEESQHVFARIDSGELVAALSVVASASDEPDYGLDINLWSDSPTQEGKTYGFGTLPFGNPALSFGTQAPFHMGFFHEPEILYLAAPFLRRTYPLLRVHQYVGLAQLAFDTGHPYWGWRFTGLAMHYLQDLTQPYHASVSPGNSAIRLISINLMAMVGLPQRKNDMIVLLSNRHLAMEGYESALVRRGARNRQPGDIEAALHDTSSDSSYPAWSATYVRNVVSLEAYRAAAETNRTIVNAMPAQLVSDPSFDYGLHAKDIDLTKRMDNADPSQRLRLDTKIAELLRHFGAHSRALVRGLMTRTPVR